MTATVNAAPAPRRRVASLAGLALALLLPAALTFLPEGPATTMTADPVRAAILNEVGTWVLTLAVLAIVVFWERRPLSSIGLVRPGWPAIRFGIYTVFALLALAMAAAFAVQQTGAPVPEGPQKLVVSLPFALQMVIAISAGFTEEVLFRGYSIERTTELTGSRFLGAIVPILVFGAAHVPFWGLAHGIVAGLTGLWLTLLYLWRRNLWTNITAHALLDALVFVAVRVGGAG